MQTLPKHLQEIADKWQAKIDAGTAAPIVVKKVTRFAVVDVTPDGYGVEDTEDEFDRLFK